MSKKRKLLHRSPIQDKNEEVSLPKVAISVYVLTSKIKKDQLAGFIYYAKSKGLVKLTIPEWSEEYVNYTKKPVRS